MNLESWNTCLFNLRVANILIVLFQVVNPKKKGKKKKYTNSGTVSHIQWYLLLVKNTDPNDLNNVEHTEIILEIDLLHLASQNKGIHWKHYLPREDVPGG